MSILLTADDAAREVGRKRATIRYWVHRGWLHPRVIGPRGQQLFALADVFECERDARHRQQAARRAGRTTRRAGGRLVPTGARSGSA